VEGYEVEAAESGRAGLETLRDRAFDLLILDAELPEEDGWGVLRAVRQDPTLVDLKVIVLMAAKGETGMLVLIPVDAELRRPFSMGALLAAVRNVIGPA
jgi:DNA-binding response OmpR family regulator